MYHVYILQCRVWFKEEVIGERLVIGQPEGYSDTIAGMSRLVGQSVIGARGHSIGQWRATVFSPQLSTIYM